MDYSAPVPVFETRCRPEWIDYNGHMNVAHYLSAFDLAVDAFLETVGLGQGYRDSAKGTMFALECRINYQREVMLGEPLAVTLQMLDLDAKRLHVFLRMWNRDKGLVVATAEQIAIHVDLKGRHSCAMPEAILAQLGALMAAHRALARPLEIDRPIGIRRREKPGTR